MNNINEEIKDFLSSFPFRILHEKDDDYEYYFVAISLEDREKIVSPILNEQFLNYINNYPLKNLNKDSMKYIENNKKKYHFLYIDKISITDPLFKAKEYYIKENANNILSKRMIGDVVDPALDLTNKIESYALQLKEVSTTIGTFAKLKFKQQLKKSKVSLEENTPIIKEKLNKVIKKIKP